MTAEEVIASLQRSRQTLAVAESLTGGLISARLTEVPGASAVVLGAVVTYAVASKTEVLGVPANLLASRGPVDPDVAQAMARGVAELFGSDLAVSTTGVAGPQPHGGHPPGTVVLGWFANGETGAHRYELAGDRGGIREQTTELALETITQCVG